MLVLSSRGLAQPHTCHHHTPFSPHAAEVELPDGSTIHLLVRGDPSHHWTETTDGYTVVKDKQGYYQYATLSNGRLVGTGVLAQDPEGRSLATQRTLLSLPRHQAPSRLLTPLDASAARTAANTRTPDYSPMPSSGKTRVLAICVDYPDLPANNTIDEFARMFNGPNNGRRSFSQYFRENSYGKLDMSVDVIGWVRAENDYKTYSNGNTGFWGGRQLAAEAINAANERGVDFSQYDNDNDGRVDGIIIIHSGRGAEEAGDDNFIWSHRWAIEGSYDGKEVDDYTIQPEIRSGERVNIGIFCHEFGHLLGLPDLYDTYNDRNERSNSGIGHWGLMAYGGWAGREVAPVGLSAWSKSALGWAEVQDITGQHGAYTLPAASNNNLFYKVRTAHANEYFLLENRQQTGVDTELPGSGLAIWHIDSDKTEQYPQSNLVNADTDRKGVDLEEADGRDELDNLTAHTGDAGDLFPGTMGNTSFTPRSYPNSDTYATHQGTTRSTMNLEHIRVQNGLVSFTYQREGASVGNSCEDATIAVLGTNESSKANHWHEFTLPRDGVISLESAASARRVRVYTECGERPLAQAEGSSVSLPYLPQGQRLFIHWEYAEQPTRPVTWQLSMEGAVARIDSLALVAVYQKMEGARWSKRTNWLRGKVASWQGVRTEGGRVTELNFDRAGLKNSLPQEFYQLSALKKFTVVEDELSGEVSADFATLSQLEEVHIEVPNLPVRFLRNIGQLTNLRILKLAGVALASALPTDIEKLQQLERLEMPNAQLTGRLPTELGELTALRHLDLSENQLVGAIPPSLFETGLRYLDLHDNQLESLPTNLLTTSALQECYLQNNQLAGGLPREVSRDTDNSFTLHLANNQLTGSVPPSWSSVDFEELLLNDNQLAGTFPSLPMPRRLDISTNNFTKLPAFTNQRSSAGTLVCHTNQLTFDDLLPNRRFLDCADCYAPQGEVAVNIERNLSTGDASTVRLPFDEEVTSSRYVWYLRNELVYESDANALRINSFTEAQAGSYECLVTNPSLPELTLRVTGVVLTIEAKQSQEITLVPVGNKQFGDAPFRLAGTSSSGLPVTYQKVEGPIAINNNVVTIQGAGTAKIMLLVAGNDEYSPTEREITFSIAKAKPVISFSEVADKTYGDAPFVLDVRADDDLSVNLTVTAGEVSLSNQTLTVEGAGTVRIRATRPEDEDYEAADPVLITFNVAKAPQLLTFDILEDLPYVPEEEITLSASASSGLPVTYEVEQGGVEVSDGVAVVQQAGEVTIVASQPGNENYLPATPRQRSFLITRATQQIFFSEVTNKKTTDPAFLLDASSSAGLPVVFNIVSGPATLSEGNQVTLQDQAGEVVIEASQAGNSNYLAAPTVTQRILVRSTDKGDQQIVLGPLPDTVLVGESVSIDAATDQGLVPEVSLDGTAQADFTDGILNFLAAGKLIVTISHPGNDDFNPVSIQRQIIVLEVPTALEPLGQTLVFGPPDRQFGESIVIATARGERPGVVVEDGPATVAEDGTIISTGTGIVVIRVTHPGNSQFTALDTVLEFLITRAVQQISFEADALTDSTFLLRAEAPSELPVTYSVDSGDGVIRGDTLVALASGEVVVTARQLGNENYLAADPVSITLGVEIVTANDPFASTHTVKIFPNPSSDVFYVLADPTVAAVKYRVVDSRGHLLSEGTLQYHRASLELGHLATGTYILYLETSRGSTYHRLLKE